jgi:hypothetical protein
MLMLVSDKTGVVDVDVKAVHKIRFHGGLKHLYIWYKPGHEIREDILCFNTLLEGEVAYSNLSVALEAEIQDYVI